MRAQIVGYIVSILGLHHRHRPWSCRRQITDYLVEVIVLFIPELRLVFPLSYQLRLRGLRSFGLASFLLLLEDVLSIPLGKGFRIFLDVGEVFKARFPWYCWLWGLLPRFSELLLKKICATLRFCCFPIRLVQPL